MPPKISFTGSSGMASSTKCPMASQALAACPRPPGIRHVRESK
jgi:hypothetical protein